MFMRRLSYKQRERATERAILMILSECTIREGARELGISKNAFHLSITTHLEKMKEEFFGIYGTAENVDFETFCLDAPYENGVYVPGMCVLIQEVLGRNWEERNSRGGRAVQRKYLIGKLLEENAN